MHDEHFYKFTKSRSISSVNREDEIGVETFLVKHNRISVSRVTDSRGDDVD